ncbi:NUDIX domain-containing protein [Streptomyces bambusae]|uniref:NUDIX domain-containing protein n=1 Tax=Streptomyces bambusae TaxID=1550616 RepID=A0ABS6YZ94_9ACTN|nr:NUDIX domain-containing protein [Streptomyces bambusae]
MAITKRSARAILLDGEDLILIKRTKPGQEPYWVTVGGGVESTDASIKDALHREVFEEVGGKLGRTELVYLISSPADGGVAVQHIFAARLDHMNIEARTGTEFTRADRGKYDIVRIPFTAEAIRQLALMPTQLRDFMADKHRGDHRSTGYTALRIRSPLTPQEDPRDRKNGSCD